MEKTRGFITIAIGDYYCKLAANLGMSYRLFSSNQYPFYVITCAHDAHRLKEYFDDVIVLDNYYGTFLDKIYIYNNTVFDETIFIDADSNITKDISYIFDLFEENGSDISVIGRIVELNEKYRGHLFSEKTIRYFNLTSDIQFNGGVYYFRKSERASKCIEFMLNDLLVNYQKYELDMAGGIRMHDEPLFLVGMLCFNMKPLNDHRKVMRPLYVQPDTLKWDIENRECSFLDYGEKISPIILHWMTNNTYSYKYVKYNAIIRSKYENYGRVRTLSKVGGV